jgi:ATP-dependent Clp protease ATP-binding subunit ClpA
MAGFEFSERVRDALARAREHAAEMRYEYIGTEHILLGLLDDTDNVAVEILRRLKVPLDEVSAQVHREAKPGTEESESAGPDLPFSHRTKRVLEEAMAEARTMGDTWLDTGHLLLGLVREKRDLGAHVLNGFGVTRDSARQVLLDLRAENRRDPGDDAQQRSSRRAGIASSRMVEIIALTPEFAPVFAAHGIDVKKLVADLRAVESTRAR